MKVRGYRIEPAEIEECLSRTAGIAGVVVTSRDFGGGDVRLVAYLVPAHPCGNGEQTAARLVAAAERHARTTLPRHLRPSGYKVISEIPMTIQGKVNRHALGN
jgi:acyl-coenzyme A synthetase/AMP-(fatty) acid ligase